MAHSAVLWGALIMGIILGDVGTEIILDCGVDVSSATERAIVVKKPNGAEVVWTAEPATATSIRYFLAEGDIDMAGRWQLQARITMPGWQGHGDAATFNVERPL